ncbi:MAG: hypothetical protein JXB46_08460 [Candidatus Eisenbacteria bacterium]|nr:hypothetical protein [Candidatus Eisenbacteria bacterium]
MLVVRLLGATIFMLGLACGGLILYGACGGGYAFGLVRTWVGFGALSVFGLMLTSLSSGLGGAESVARLAGMAVLGLGAICGAMLILSKIGVVQLADTMQPWALLAVCAVAGGTLTFGSRV